MIVQVIKTLLMAIGLGFLLQVLQTFLETNYLVKFLSENLITILIALLAINSATMGIVLTKIRDLVEQHGNAHLFTATRQQMVLAVQEHIGLIAIATLALMLGDSAILSKYENTRPLLDSAIIAVFVYALIVLYDTAKGVLIIIDFDGKQDG